MGCTSICRTLSYHFRSLLDVCLIINIPSMYKTCHVSKSRVLIYVCLYVLVPFCLQMCQFWYIGKIYLSYLLCICKDVKLIHINNLLCVLIHFFYYFIFIQGNAPDILANLDNKLQTMPTRFSSFSHYSNILFPMIVHDIWASIQSSYQVLYITWLNM